MFIATITFAMTVATMSHHQYPMSGEILMVMISTTCSCGVTTVENRQSYSDALGMLQDMYYTKRVTYPEVRYTEYGGQPEESIHECNTCFSEWGDGHEDSCIGKEAIEAIENFIERVF